MITPSFTNILVIVVLTIFCVSAFCRKREVYRDIYMDVNATTHMSSAALRAYVKTAKRSPGNPSSSYAIGREAKRHLVDALGSIKTMLRCTSADACLIPMSGATEANNTVIHACSANGTVLATPLEHASVSNCGIDKLCIDCNGAVDLRRLSSRLHHGDVSLVCIIWGNNETGAIQPIEDISRICSHHGVLLHVDATQVVGRYVVNADKLFSEGVNSVSFSSHKFNGPRGVGFLLADSKICRMVCEYPLLRGGSQCANMRPGTENVAGIVSSAVALKGSLKNVSKKISTVMSLRDSLLRDLKTLGAVDNTPAHCTRLYNTLNVSFIGVDSRQLMYHLDKKRIYVGVGSACSKAGASSVLRSLGYDETREQGALRVSLSDEHTRSDCRRLVREIENYLQGMQYYR